MEYNRYLDLHLCTSSITALLKKRKGYKPERGDRRFFIHEKIEYFYDFEASGNFKGDFENGLRNRLKKNPGYQDSNSKILRFVEVTRSHSSLLQFNNATISEELRRLRYLGCLVAIEHLKDGRVYPQLQALMSWISDASTINKLRVNCHGAGTSNSGFKMGDIELTPAELVEAFVQHGLTRDGRKNEQFRGIAHAARWKHDKEVTACERCRTDFTKSWTGSSNKHHCRRCGGIFCAACSAETLDLETALVGPDKPPAKNVKRARVCRDCFDAVRSIAKANAIKSIGLQPADKGDNLPYGLQTITLACCMSAKSDTEHSPVGPVTSQAEARFVADSLASRFVAALRTKKIRGVKVTGSNMLVGMDKRDARGIENITVIKHPSDTGPKERGFVTDDPWFFIPKDVWGVKDALENVYAAMKDEDRPDCLEITIGPSRRDLEFGKVSGSDLTSETKLAKLEETLKEWHFPSWLKKRDTCSGPPTQIGTSWRTIRLTAPPTIERIEPAYEKGKKVAIKIWARQNDQLFRWFKSYEVS